MIEFQGKVRRRINDGHHYDVCKYSEYLYTTYRSQPAAAIHVYSTLNWQQTRVIHLCASIDHAHKLHVNGQHMVLSCSITHCIYTMSMDGQLIEKYDNKGSGVGEFKWPQICMSDCEDCLLIVDYGNDRFQVRHGQQWSVLQLQPQQSEPRGAVYDGHALYVITTNYPWPLLKYEWVIIRY